MCYQYLSRISGGRGGIRTHGTLAGTPVFKTGALNHSATLPLQPHQPFGGRQIKNGLWPGPGLDPDNVRPREIQPSARLVGLCHDELFLLSTKPCWAPDATVLK